MDDWIDEWLAIFRAKRLKQRIERFPSNNKECKNCGVKLLPIHVGNRWCGDCEMIPFNERDGFYYRMSC